MKEAITGIVLAGGKSTRMGTDKGLVVLKGKPMIQYVLDTLLPICNRILIVTENEEYRQFGYELVPDEKPNLGPVMGILSGLKQSSTPKNIVISCDAPYVTTDLLLQLKNASSNCQAVIASSKENLHPLISVYDRSCVPEFETALQANEQRLQNVLQRLDVHTVFVSGEMAKMVSNINSHLDLIT